MDFSVFCAKFNEWVVEATNVLIIKKETDP